MSDKAMVMYDSPEAAKQTTVTGWVSGDGRFYGDNEHLARWAGSTHQKCECGEVFEKGRTKCRSCEAKQQTERYYALPVEEWDGATPICLWDDDLYFFGEDEFLDYLADMKDATSNEVPEVQAVLCVPGKLGYVSEDNWADDLPEDGELPEEVAVKLSELNEAIKKAPVVAWFAGKIRINMDALWAKLAAEK
jgi:hypothetical protein